MKKVFAFILLIGILSACASANIEVTKKNGDTCKGSYKSFFKDATGVQIGACGAEGTATNTQSNADLLKEVLQVIK
jgi:hypothetical protein